MEKKANVPVDSPAAPEPAKVETVPKALLDALDAAWRDCIANRPANGKVRFIVNDERLIKYAQNLAGPDVEILFHANNPAPVVWRVVKDERFAANKVNRFRQG
jgi:hypothetical protein